MKKQINTTLPPLVITEEKKIENKFIDLIHNIKWLTNNDAIQLSHFMDLNIVSLCLLLKRIYYEFDNSCLKKVICPPNGKLFPEEHNFYMKLNNFVQMNASLIIVRKYVLNILEKLITSGIDTHHKCIGANMICSCLDEIVTYQYHFMF